MTTCAQLATWLSEAQTALHAVQIGNRVEMMEYGSKRVTFTRANIDALRRYVTDLQAKVDACNGKTSTRRAIRILPV